MIDRNVLHKPVMVEEVLKHFDLPTAPLQNFVSKEKKKVFADLTLGSAGHAVEIIKRGGYVVGVEVDPELTKIARKALEEVCGAYPACPADNFDESFVIVNDNFINIDQVFSKAGIERVDGILLDLGVSSIHMDDMSRGFSFKNPQSPLDMRLTPAQGVKASDLLNALPKDRLIALFSEFISYRASRNISNEIILARKSKKIETVGDFLRVIELSGIKNSLSKNKKINFATLPFMALRIAVNTELDNLNEVLPKAFALLKPGGSMIVISFHSLEDKIVKKFIREVLDKGEGNTGSEKPITPTEQEIFSNPRSRSAKLRYLKKNVQK